MSCSFLCHSYCLPKQPGSYLLIFAKCVKTELVPHNGGASTHDFSYKLTLKLL